MNKSRQFIHYRANNKQGINQLLRGKGWIARLVCNDAENRARCRMQLLATNIGSILDRAIN